MAGRGAPAPDPRRPRTPRTWLGISTVIRSKYLHVWLHSLVNETIQAAPKTLLFLQLGLSSAFSFAATFRARKQSFRRSPWVNSCNKLGAFGPSLQSQRWASKDVLDEGASRDLPRRGGTSPTPLPLHHLAHRPSITITPTHYRHQSRRRAALPDKAAAPLHFRSWCPLFETITLLFRGNKTKKDPEASFLSICALMTH